MLLDRDRETRKPGPIDLLKALGTVEKQLRLARSEILSLNKRLKMLERRTQNIEQWKGEQK
jgi:hypothetical protein